MAKNRGNHPCRYCGCTMLRSGECGPTHPRRMTQDYFWPRRMRNANYASTRLLVCKACNEAKAGINPLQWIRVMPEYGVVRAVSIILHWYPELADSVYTMLTQRGNEPEQIQKIIDEARTGLRA